MLASFTFWELISFKGLIVLELFFSFSIKNPYSLLNYNDRSSHLYKSIPLNYVNEADHTLAIRGNAANISSFLWKGATDARHGSCLVNWRTVNRDKKLGGHKSRI